MIQLLSLGELITAEELYSRKFRLKTFFAGWVASDAITTGRVDLVPSRFSRIPRLVESGFFPVDAAFVQITPPDEHGYASLGLSVDFVRQAMDRAKLVVGEINEAVPRTQGDTYVHISEFDWFLESTEPLIFTPRWPTDEVFDRVAANVASLVEDGACLGFSIGPLYDHLPAHLARKKNLGVHSPLVTDAVMELIESGAVTNRYKGFFRGKSLCCHAMGTPELIRWLNRNPLVEFQGLDVVYDPANIGRNNRFTAIAPARKVDITGNVALHTGKGNVAAGPGEVLDLFEGAKLSAGGLGVFALPSRNLAGESNIKLSVDSYPNEVPLRESLDAIVTDYGVAWLTGRTIRERAQAIIDVAHPDDREELVRLAKENHVLYPDQIYLPDAAALYPGDLEFTHTFKDGLTVGFRPIKPSDEEAMRGLFYGFSDEAVYYRYFSPIKTMPHAKMQQYVNVDFTRIMSIVGFAVSPVGKRRLICEARWAQSPRQPFPDVAFVVDEAYQRKGIATFLLDLLIRLAKQRGIRGFTADVLATNKAMMKVFERSPHAVRAVPGQRRLRADHPVRRRPGERPRDSVRPAGCREMTGRRGRRIRTAVFMAVPALIVLLFLEGGARLLLENERFRTWIVGDQSVVQTLASVHEAMYRHVFRTTFDPYNGYRVADLPDPESRRPPHLPVPPKAPGEVRIVCLGDSTTFGIHLREPETWPARLETDLNRTAPGRNARDRLQRRGPGLWLPAVQAPPAKPLPLGRAGRRPVARGAQVRRPPGTAGGAAGGMDPPPTCAPVVPIHLPAGELENDPGPGTRHGRPATGVEPVQRPRPKRTRLPPRRPAALYVLVERKTRGRSDRRGVPFLHGLRVPRGPSVLLRIRHRVRNDPRRERRGVGPPRCRRHPPARSARGDRRRPSPVLRRLLSLFAKRCRHGRTNRRKRPSQTLSEPVRRAGRRRPDGSLARRSIRITSCKKCWLMAI